MTRTLFVLLILAFTQITGWGVIGFLPVLAPAIAGDLHVPLPTVFFGTATMYVVMGLAAPLIGKAFRRLGGKNVMTAGAVLIAAGLAIVSVAGSIATYLAAWALLGTAGAMFLTTAAYIYLSDYADERARGMIGSLMLVTGLAGSVFWPLTAYLQHLVDWRATIQIYSAIMIVLVTPLISFGLPDVRGVSKSEEPRSQATHRSKVFWFFVTAIALNSFVTYGMEAIGIELFRALGAEQSFAVGIASLIGILKVCGRLIDLLGGKHWDALSTGIVAGAMIPLGLLVLLPFGGAAAAVVVCLLFFGVGSGAFAVARATMPLVFFRKSEYAAAMSAIALPMNLTSAIAAPILSGLLTASGTLATLTLLIVCSTIALILLVKLGGLRKQDLAPTS
ncbi:MFS transporter [Rhizobium sp. CNPSo 3968]|uniref:MFS transporter n=1 Tax=Rhizobium sp. CNPSo 3968 TaxID=3021408 RepID=UPI002549F269|nr:MFS transporter [Rhizobium sp. CNPSo 3968]MDK4717779.1 MFS transporter [Rhizobium sp. CNPSo 3968]